jgi:DNA-binding CsgD family transcriptional regulator
VLETTFAALGLSAQQEAVLRALIDRPGSTAEELAEVLALSPRPVRSALTSLQDQGLLRRAVGRPPRFSAAQPDLALEAMIRRREDELQAARLEVSRLMDHYRRASEPTGSAELLEVLSTPDAVGQYFQQLQQSVREEMLGMDRPPYPPGGPVFNETELECLARGVTYRALYDRSLLSMGYDEPIRRYQAAGEQARVTTGLPTKLAIADRRVALLPLHREGLPANGAIVVHASPLLDSLVSLFELLWRRATPLALGRPVGPEGGDEDEAISELDRRLLSMLAAGMKDEAIARQLGVNVRTVVRRVARLMQELGADTRFQAGLQAARRQLL